MQASSSKDPGIEAVHSKENTKQAVNALHGTLKWPGLKKQGRLANVLGALQNARCSVMTSLRSAAAGLSDRQIQSLHQPFLHTRHSPPQLQVSQKAIEGELERGRLILLNHKVTCKPREFKLGFRLPAAVNDQATAQRRRRRPPSGTQREHPPATHPATHSHIPPRALPAAAMAASAVRLPAAS